MNGASGDDWMGTDMPNPADLDMFDDIASKLPLRGYGAIC